MVTKRGRVAYHTESTVRQFSLLQEGLQPVITVSNTLLDAQIEQFGLPRPTIDADGSVVRTGGRVTWAFMADRGAQEKTPADLKGGVRPGCRPDEPQRSEQRLARDPVTEVLYRRVAQALAA